MNNARLGRGHADPPTFEGKIHTLRQSVRVVPRSRAHVGALAGRPQALSKPKCPHVEDREFRMGSVTSARDHNLGIDDDLLVARAQDDAVELCDAHTEQGEEGGGASALREGERGEGLGSSRR